MPNASVLATCRFLGCRRQDARVTARVFAPGLEALKRTRLVAPDVRVIMYSSHSAEKKATLMLDAGARAYLQKPCSLEVLVQAVQAWTRPEQLKLGHAIASASSVASANRSSDFGMPPC